MNPNPTSPLLFAAFLVVAFFAIAKARGGRQKTVTAVVIVAFMALGIAAGALFGWWARSPEAGGHLAGSLTILFGLASGVAMLLRNRQDQARGSRSASAGK